MPALEADGGFSFIDGTVQGSFGDFRDIDSRGHRVGLAITYRLNIGEQINELAALRKELDATVFSTLDAERRLILRVVELYENVVLSKIGVNIAGQLVADAESFVHITRVRAESGVGLGADTARAEASVAAAKQRLEEVRGIWRQTSVRLAVVLRNDPIVLLDPADTELDEWEIAARNNDDALETVALNRPDVESARQQVQAESDRIRTARWDLFGPEIIADARWSGVGGHGERSLPDRGRVISNTAGSFGRAANSWQNVLSGSASPSTAAGSFGRAFYNYQDLFRDADQNIGLEGRTNLSIGLVWRLSFEKRDRVRELRARRDRNELQVRQLEDKAVGEVRSAQQAIGSSSRLIALARDELTATEKTHRIALARFREGTAITLEVLDAQQAVAQARLNLAGI